MRADDLYKFSDGTLKSVRDKIHHRVLEFRLDYNLEMPKIKWTALDRKRSGLMIELIDKKLQEREIIKNLERLVGAQELEMDYKLMTSTYGDVNISLTDTEPTDKEKDDEEMTVAGHVNVNEEGADNQVKDDAQATQKIEGPFPSSFISSDYAAKYLNFDNIPPVDTEVVSIITNLEKDVKELKTIDHSATLLSTIKIEVPNAVKEYLGTSLDDALHKVLQKHSANITKEQSVPA
ncbi:hypothetical protein Tco_1213024 [Tanacetum coccineum]